MAQFFKFPNIAGTAYDAGWQPNSPGENDGPWFPARPIVPWPRVVNTISALASDPGTPRMRAILPQVNRYSPFPMNYLFLGGVVGKSQG